MAATRKKATPFTPTLVTRSALAAATLAAVALATLAGCSASGPAAGPGASVGGMIAPLSVSSEDFSDGGGLAATFAGGDAARCAGDNLNPQLAWSPGPPGTASYAIAMNDPDARGYSHWLHVDIPADLASVARGASASLPGTTGRGTNGTAAYYGPCPPSRHHYVFTVYALDTLLEPGRALTWNEFAAAADGHVLAEGSITGLFPPP
jgi:Raf kinase inhibitor-like YbhB/YbcL family protein